MNIGIIGCGHMGSAIAKALIAKKIGRILVGNPEKPRIAVKWTANNKDAAKNADFIFIAVKPAIVREILEEIKPILRPNQILISIAAGIPLAKLQKWSGGHKKIARVMPNLAAQVFEGISVWKASSGLNTAEKKLVAKLLCAFGKAIEVQNEKLIDVATAISGGGPAYTAAFLESMSDVAQKIGFSKEDARMLALQSVKGSIAYLEQTKTDFCALKKAVQTKGGTTEAGFKVLKKRKWQFALEKAFLAGYKKARTLSL